MVSSVPGNGGIVRVMNQDSVKRRSPSQSGTPGDTPNTTVQESYSWLRQTWLKSHQLDLVLYARTKVTDLRPGKAVGERHKQGPLLRKDPKLYFFVLVFKKKPRVLPHNTKEGSETLLRIYR